MTVQELSKLFYLKANSQKLHARLKELRSAATRIGSSWASGMPRYSGVDSRTERFAVKIADIEAALNALELQMVQEEIRLHRFISTVPDCRLRLILTFRFVDCCPTWDTVADRLGGDNDAESVKKLAYRYLKSTEHPSEARESV